MKDEERRSIIRTIVVTLTVLAAIAAALAIAYKLFKKYFKVTLDCGDCDECSIGCFDEDFDPLSDDDFAPKCVLDDEDSEAEEA